MNLNTFVIPFIKGGISPKTFETYDEGFNFAITQQGRGALPPQRLGDYLNKAALNGMYDRVKLDFTFLNNYADAHLVACRDYVLNEWMK